jgi:hypothetical protein
MRHRIILLLQQPEKGHAGKRFLPMRAIGAFEIRCQGTDL